MQRRPQPTAFPSAVVSPCTRADEPIPPSNPTKAPVPVVPDQNMPSTNVANSGAFTKANTNWITSMALLYIFAK